jgi:MFS family permease
LTQSLISPAGRWTERAANSAIFLGSGLGIGAWAASIPLLKTRLHLSDGALSLVLLGFAAGAVLAMPLAGRLAPRLGVARATRFFALVFALALAAPFLSPGLAALAGAAFLMGLANGALDVSMNGLASGMETRWGAPIMSSFHAAFSIGGLGGATLGAAMAGRSASAINAMSLVALIMSRQSLSSGARCATSARRRRQSRRASPGLIARRSGCRPASLWGCSAKER